MTTQASILGPTLIPETGVYFSKLTGQLSLTNVKNQLCLVMPFPTGADLGFELNFVVPQNYSSSPVLVAKMVLDGTPSGTLAFGAQLLQAASSDTIDSAYEAEDTVSNSVWTGYADEEIYTASITLTPSVAFSPGNLVFIKFYRDDSVDNTSFDILLLDLLFQYTEA